MTEQTQAPVETKNRDLAEEFAAAIFMRCTMLHALEQRVTGAVSQARSESRDLTDDELAKLTADPEAAPFVKGAAAAVLTEIKGGK